VSNGVSEGTGVRYDANRAKGIAEGMFGYDSNYEAQNIQANLEQNDAREVELKSADADVLLEKLQAQVKDRTTIIARRTRQNDHDQHPSMAISSDGQQLNSPIGRVPHQYNPPVV
jgi:hypothetical protein